MLSRILNIALFFFLCLTVSQNAHCNSVKADSLIQRLIDESQVQAETNLGMASYKAKRAIRVASRKDRGLFLGHAYFNYGQILKKKYFFKDALQAFLKAEGIYSRNGDRENLQKLRGELATLFLDLGDYKQAVLLFHELREGERSQDGANKFIYYSLKIADCHLRKGNYADAKKEIEQSKIILEKKSDYLSELDVLGLEVRALLKQGQNKKALSLLNEAKVRYEKINVRKSGLYLLFAETLMKLSKREKAMEFFLQAREEFAEHEDFINEANSLVNLSELFSSSDSLQLYVKPLMESVRTFKSVGLVYSEAYAKIRLAHLYELKAKYDSAIVWLQHASSDYSKLGSKHGVANTEWLKGDVYFSKGHEAFALESYTKAYKLFMELQDSTNALACVLEQVKAQNSLGLFELSRKSLSFHKDQFEKVNASLRKTYYELYSEVCSNLKLYDKALSLYKKASVLRDSLTKIESAKSFEELKWSYNSKLSERLWNSDELLDRTNNEFRTENRRMKKFSLFIVGVGCFALIVFSVLFYMQKHSNRQTKLELAMRTQELRDKEKQYNLTSAIVTHQNKIINKQVHDLDLSLENANRNLEDLLPSKERLNEVLLEHILIYKSKEIVGGDFYWVHDTGTHRVCVLADSSGTAIESALLSVFLLKSLDELKEFNYTEPTDYLTSLDFRIKESFGEENEYLAGVRMAVVTIEKSSNELRFSGARMNMYYFRNEQLSKYKGDNCKLGLNNSTPVFTSHIIKSETFDQIVLMTKGVLSQFKKGLQSRITEKRFLKEMEVNSTYEIEEQRKAVEQLVLDNRESDQQLDDLSFLTWKIS